MLCPKLCGSAAIDYVDYMAVHWDIVTTVSKYGWNILTLLGEKMI